MEQGKSFFAPFFSTLSKLTFILFFFFFLFDCIVKTGHEDFPVDDISRNPEIFEIIDLHAQEENPVLDSIEISQSPRDSIDVVDPWDKVRNSLRLFNLIRFQEIKEKGSPSSTKARQALKNITEIEKDQIPDKIIGDVPGTNGFLSVMFSILNKKNKQLTFC